MYKFSAIAVSEGFAKAPALCIQKPDLSVDKAVIRDKDAEKHALQNAIDQSIDQLVALIKKSGQALGEKNAEIFDAHIMMLKDQEFTENMFNMIDSDSVCASYAAHETGVVFAEIFQKMDDEYMRARAADIRDVVNRIIKNLKGIKDDDLDNIDSPCLIIAYDLTPSETAKIASKSVLGFITQIGGKTSHSAIMARSLGIPAVCGIGSEVKNFKTGDMVLLDGISGQIIVRPEGNDEEGFDKKADEYKKYRENLLKFRDKKGATSDGHEILIEGNIGTPEDADKVLAQGGEGVGLFRSEFLFMDRDTLPSEEEQFEAYRAAAQKMGNKPVIIRTLDIGGDKEVKPLGLEKEQNPFLGYRAIRICLDRQDLFKIQLRALLRASAFGRIKIMFPMISSLEEVVAAKDVLNQAKYELDSQNIAYDKRIQIGIMIEIPAAAVLSDVLSKEVDFFSIGTNDLIQYSCAVDRINEKISYLYRPLHPSILRLIALTAKNAKESGIEVGVCGEMAGENGMAIVLCGLGVTNLSMSASSILRAKQQLSCKTFDQCKNIANQLLSCKSALQAQDKFKELLGF